MVRDQESGLKPSWVLTSPSISLRPSDEPKAVKDGVMWPSLMWMGWAEAGMAQAPRQVMAPAWTTTVAGEVEERDRVWLGRLTCVMPVKTVMSSMEAVSCFV